MLELILVSSICGYLIVSFYRLSKIQREKAQGLKEIAQERNLNLNESEHLKMRIRFAKIQRRIVYVLLGFYTIYLVLWFCRYE
jgi:hypothetical protein